MRASRIGKPLLSITHVSCRSGRLAIGPWIVSCYERCRQRADERARLTVYHFHGCVMSGGQRFHDPAPHASATPANKAIIGGIWAKPRRQIAPWCAGTRHPKDAVQHSLPAADEAFNIVVRNPTEVGH